MKFRRDLYVIVTGIVAVSLFIAGLTAGLDSGTEEACRFAGYLQQTPLLLVCYIIGAAGVIWLGWYWLRLAGAITSIARRLKKETAECPLPIAECKSKTGNRKCIVSGLSLQIP